MDRREGPSAYLGNKLLCYERHGRQTKGAGLCDCDI